MAAQGYVVVYYDLEATGLRQHYDEVVQIGARCGNYDFSRYIMPSIPMDPQATAVNGLTAANGRLFRNGMPVQCWMPQQAWVDFVNFLSQCASGRRVVLVAHGGFNFDHRMLMRAVKGLGLQQSLLAVAPYGSDTVPLLPPQLKGQSLSDMARLYGLPAGNAHDALADAIMLQGLCKRLAITDSAIIASAQPMTNF